MEEAKYIVEFRILIVYAVVLPQVMHSCQEISLVQSHSTVVQLPSNRVPLTKYTAGKCSVFGLVLQ